MASRTPPELTFWSSYRVVPSEPPDAGVAETVTDSIAYLVVKLTRVRSESKYNVIAYVRKFHTCALIILSLLSVTAISFASILFEIVLPVEHGERTAVVPRYERRVVRSVHV